MTEVADKCREAAMDDYLTKPIEFESLHKILLKWLPESKREAAEAAAPDADAYKRLRDVCGECKKRIMEIRMILQYIVLLQYITAILCNISFALDGSYGIIAERLLLYSDARGRDDVMRAVR